MNKKILSFFLMASLFLAACGVNNRNKQPEIEVKDESGTEEIKLEEFSDTYIQEEIGKVIESDEGHRTVVKALYDLNNHQEKGPFRITIQDVRLSQFKPHTEKVEKYGGYDLSLVSIHLLVENLSNEKAMVYPTQGVLETDTGKKADAHFSLSDQIGGAFEGRTAKEGIVYCFFDSKAEDVSQVTYHIEAAHDENIQPLGEDFEFILQFD